MFLDDYEAAVRVLAPEETSVSHEAQHLVAVSERVVYDGERGYSLDAETLAIGSRGGGVRLLNAE